MNYTESLRAHHKTLTPKDCIGWINSVYDNNGNEYQYFKVNDAQDAGIDTGEYECILCQMSLPPSFHHMSYDLTTKKITEKDQIGSSNGGADLTFLTNIRPCTPNDYKDQDGKDIDSISFLENHILKRDYKNIRQAEEGFRIRSCSDDCRESMIFGLSRDANLSKRKIKFFGRSIDRPSDPAWIYYLPAIGKVPESATCEHPASVCFFRTKDVNLVLSWLWLCEKPEMHQNSGIAIHHPVFHNEQIDGMMLKVFDDPRAIIPSPGCNAVLLNPSIPA